MTKEELEKYTVDFMNNETGLKYSKINSVLGKMLIKYAEIFQKQIAELEDKLANADYQLEGRDNEIAELEQENKVLTQNLEQKIEKIINEIDKTMCLSTMRECEIYDIQEIFRKYGFKRNNNNAWEIKE